MDMIGISEGSFEWALMHLKNGAKVQRKGWNGKGMHVETVKFTCSNGIKVDNIGMVIKTPIGKYNNWIPSITDLFAEDWEVVE